MILYINRNFSPASIELESGARVDVLPVKLGGVHSYEIVFRGDIEPSALSIGIKERGQFSDELLAYGETLFPESKQGEHVFSVDVNTNTAELAAAIGERDRLPAMMEFAWMEGPTKRVSATVSCAVFNEVIGDPSIYPSPRPQYPDADAVASAVNHVENSSIHVSDADKETWNNKATLEEVEQLLTAETVQNTIATPAGTDNATANYLILGASNVPRGELVSLSVRCGSNFNGGVTTAPLYLAVYEQAETGGEDFALAGVSRNSITQEINTNSAWTFDGVELHGRKIKLIPTTDPTNTESATAKLRVRTVAGNDGSQMHYNGTTYNWRAQVEILYNHTLPRFVTPTDLAQHTNDTSIHITPEEREMWSNSGSSLTDEQQRILDSFEHNETYGLSLVHRDPDSVIDGRLRLMINSGTINLVSGYPVSLQTAQLINSTRSKAETFTDPTTGASYSFRGFTTNAAEMQPYGIIEPCVWAGDSQIPLLLRGSEIRLNGSTLDVAALMELLTHKDELIALINN